MEHPIYRVTRFEVLGDYRLCVSFDDGTSQVIDFRPILKGRLFGPLTNHELFAQVRLDEEAHTLVWPTGADLDPATLHDWPQLAAEFEQLAERWEEAQARV